MVRGHAIRLRASVLNRAVTVYDKDADMTKRELVAEVARTADLKAADAERVVDQVFRSVVRALSRGEKVEIRWFGSFRRHQRAARVGRNPKTGKRIDVPAKTSAVFRPSKELKQLVNSRADQVSGLPI